MIYAIAKIIEGKDLRGYRLFNTETLEVEDLKIQEINPDLKVENLNYKVVDTSAFYEHLSDGDKTKYEQVIITLNDEVDNGYTKIDTNGKLIKHSSLVVLERISAVKYKCVDYTGKINEITLNQYYDIKLANGELHEVDGFSTISPLTGEYSYKVDKDKVKKATEKLEQYNLKAKLLGVNNMSIRVIGEDVVLMSADKDIQKCDIPKFVNILYNSCFSYRENLTSIHIPDSITYIGHYAFGGCKKLKRVYMSNNVEVIGDNAFSDCKSLIGVELPNKINTIPNLLFFSCESLKSITIPESVKEIKESAFSNCANLTEVIFKTEFVKLGESVFAYCSMLTDIKLPRIKILRERLFSNCIKLEKVEMSNVNVIEDRVFQECESISEVFIPEGVRELGHLVFTDCYSLKKIQLPNTLKKTYNDTFDNIAEDCMILVPKGLGDEGNFTVRTYNTF